MSYIKNPYSLSDAALLREIGKGIKQMRLNKNITQQELATNSGLDRVTISKLENGNVTTVLTLIQVLRSLERLEVLENFNEGPQISPLVLAEMAGKYRKRARHNNPTNNNETESEW